MILVTGGTGFAGRHLVRGLVAKGHEVRVFTRAPGRTTLPASVQWARGDLAEPESIRAALHGVEIVIHAGAVVREGDDPDLERVNAQGTAQLARAAREAGLRRFIHVSSAGVYGDGSSTMPHAEADAPEPCTPYERSKLSAERALLEALAGSDVRWTILRPQGLYGADRPATALFFKSVANRRVWIHGPAQVIVHPTHVSDLVTAIELVLLRDDLHGEIFNVGGERALQFRDLIEMVGERMGHRPRQVTLPGVMGWCARLAGRWWPGKAPALLDRLGRRIVNRAVSIDKARTKLGFEPLGLEVGLGLTAAALGGRPLSWPAVDG